MADGFLVGQDTRQGKRFRNTRRRPEFLGLEERIHLLTGQHPELHRNVAKAGFALALTIQDHINLFGLQQAMLDCDHTDRFSDVPHLLGGFMFELGRNQFPLDEKLNKRMVHAVVSTIRPGFPQIVIRELAPRPNDEGDTIPAVKGIDLPGGCVEFGVGFR